jgi:hypothetical protein
MSVGLGIAIGYALAGAGCVDPEPVIHTCTVLYRCVGSDHMSARVALPCALDEDEAAERASLLWQTQGAPTDCPAGWTTVRAECDVYEPETTCP